MLVKIETCLPRAEPRRPRASTPVSRLVRARGLLSQLLRAASDTSLRLSIHRDHKRRAQLARDSIDEDSAPNRLSEIVALYGERRRPRTRECECSSCRRGVRSGSLRPSRSASLGCRRLVAPTRATVEASSMRSRHLMLARAVTAWLMPRCQLLTTAASLPEGTSTVVCRW